MIRIHSTKKLFAKLPVNSEGRLPSMKGSVPSSVSMPESLNPLSGWHANLVLFQRRNCVLFVHDKTRFTMLATCLTKPDFADLERHFADVFMNTLLHLNASEQQLDTASRLLQTMVIDTLCDRSVQGTMNQMKQMTDHIFWSDNIDITKLSPYSFSARLSGTPCMIKGQKDCLWPIRDMFELLDQASKAVEQGDSKQDSLIKDSLVKDRPTKTSANTDKTNKVVSMADFRKQT